MYFGKNRIHAENVTFNCLRHFYNHTVEPRFKVCYAAIPAENA